MVFGSREMVSGHRSMVLPGSDMPSALGLVFTGSAQKVLSMELVPPNSKKTTKYTGSAQYIKNGKVSQRSSNSLFLRHYAGERFSKVSSLKW